MVEKIKKFLFINTGTRQTILKNTFWLFIGEAVGRTLKLFLIVFATRKMGVEGWGTFSYALAFVSLFFIFGDFGINTFLTKELSQDHENRKKYLATSAILKATTLLLFFIITITVAPLVGKIRIDFNTIFVFSSFFVFESIREFAMAINRSLERMEVEGFSKILINLSISILGLMLLVRDNTPISLALAYMIGSMLATIYVVWSVRKEFKGIDWRFSKKDFKKIYEFSWPVVIISLFGFLFGLDTIMLGQMKSAVEVGIYTTPQKLIAFLSIIPGFIGVAAFPVLAKNEHNTERLENIFSKIMLVILAIGIPLSIGGMIFSKEIIELSLGSQYIASSSVFAVLMISILASFPNIFLTHLIFSKNLQKYFIFVASIGVFLNIGLNFWLIPKYGAVGAAISTTIAELIIMASNWKKLKRFVSFSVVPKLGKVILATILMTIFVLILDTTGIYFLINIGLATIVYFLALKIMKEKILEDIIALRR